jgi:hypothetical protein
MTLKKGLVLVCASALLVAPGLAEDKKKKDKPDTSKEIYYATYSEKAGRITVVVSSYLMALESAEKFVPLRVAVGVWGKGPELAIGIDSFLLFDAKGDMYSTAATQEIGTLTSLIRQTEEMARQHPLQTGNAFTNYHRVRSNLYTAEGVGDRYVYVDRETYFEDIIWFPLPTNGLEGVLKLQMETEGMEGPVEVRFQVPKMGGKKKHEEAQEG